jgi:sporulation protein YlmC with PRC-barrel domain
MTPLRNHVLTIASALLFCGASAAQEPADEAHSRAIPQTELKPGDVRASNLLGAMVKRLSGEAIGEVEDLIVSSEADVRLAVISVGGVLGLGAKTIAVPFDEFTVAPDGSAIYLGITQEELEAQPAFDLESATTALHTAAHQPAAPAISPPPQSSAFAVPGAGTQEAHDGPTLAQQPPSQEVYGENSAATTKAQAFNQPVSTLIGAQVVDTQNSPLGRINDLLVSAEPPEVQVIVELTGAPESSSSARSVAVPLSDLAIPRGQGEDARRQIESVETSLTVSQLETLPQYHY